ncbi:tRNA-queuosine alpha-mannosyltransferase-like isoform 2-T2 [Menidia menidia]
MESFLSRVPSFMKKIPDHRPRDLVQQIRPKCLVLSYPVQFPDVSSLLPEHKRRRRPAGPSPADDIISGQEEQRSPRSQVDPDRPSIQRGPGGGGPGLEGPGPGPGGLEGPGLEGPGPGPGGLEGPGPGGLEGPGLEGPGPGPGLEGPGPGPGLEGPNPNPNPNPGGGGPLHIVWPHRWEHDKNPELFFSTMIKLSEMGLQFQLSVLGESFSQVPEVFSSSLPLLAPHICSWGFLPRGQFLAQLCQADLVLSTAKHEFFGVAMLEAVHCGCYPLCPNALVYPEIFPAQYLYSTPEQLLRRLQQLCRRPDVARRHVVKVDTSLYSWDSLKPRYQTLLAPDPDPVQTGPDPDPREAPDPVHLVKASVDPL